MQLSVSMWSLDRAIQADGFSQLDFIRWAKHLGLNHVELLSYYMENEGNFNEVKDALDEMGMQVSCYTINNDFTVDSPESYARFIHDLDRASELKAPYVRILAGDENHSKDSAVKNILAGFSKAAREAEKRNIVLVLENVGRYSCHSSDVMNLIRSTDSRQVKINFDTANALLADEDPMDSLSAFLKDTAYVHIKDFISEESPAFGKIVSRDESRKQTSEKGLAITGITAGEGIIPLKPIIDELKKSGYTGFLSTEYEGTGDALKDCKASIEYLKNIL